MGAHFLIVGAVLFGLSAEASAGESNGLFQRASCTLVRFYVTKYSASAAESWARSKGATEADIEAGRRCLKGMPVLTAQRVAE